MIGAILKMMRIDMRALLLLAIVTCGLSVVQADEVDEVRVPAEKGARKPRLTVVPVYPELARRERVEGEVQVCFTVDRKGNTHRVRVRKSTNRIFEKPSILAARASTYEPLPEDKEMSGIKTCRTFRFHLNPVAIERPS
jgi:TonB family protein